MNRTIASAFTVAALLTAGAVACKPELESPPVRATVRLVRAPDGMIDVVVDGSLSGPGALQLTLAIRPEGAWQIDAAQSPAAPPLDTVRARMRGGDRAIVFIGDKRGVRLGGNGVAARLSLQPAGDARTPGTLAITRALLVDAEGRVLPADTAPGIPLR